MKQFSAAYPLTVIEWMVHFEKKVQAADGFTQQVVAELLSYDNQCVVISQQGVAKLDDSLFLRSILARISWSHHVVLLDKVGDTAQRFWYMTQCIECGIGRNVLSLQIENGLFERQVKSKKVSNFSQTLPAPQTDLVDYLFKDPYIFDFIQAKDKADERDIESQLTEHITKFLLELGQGFAFIGKQMHFEVGKQDFYVDLLFYHTKLHAYVVVELKAREFEPGDAGKLNFYINLVNDRLKGSKDNDTIGLLLCRGKNAVLAEYAIKNINQPIGVSDYEFSKAIPKELKSQLPDISELENELLKEKSVC